MNVEARAPRAWVRERARTAARWYGRSMEALALDPLEAELRRAGATFGRDHDRVISLSYGSVAGEIAVAERAVGLADRNDLSVLAVTGSAGRVAESVQRTAGRRPEPNETWAAAGVWWHALSGERVLAIADWRATQRLHHAFHAPSPGLRVGADLVDVSDDYKVLTLIGPRAPKLLRTIGLENVPDAGTASETTIAGERALVLHESDAAFLLVTAGPGAVETWKLLRDQGRPLGIGFVGAQALARLGVSERARARRHA